MSLFYGNKRTATEFARYQTIGIITYGPDTGTLSKIHAKTAQHCRAE